MKIALRYPSDNDFLALPKNRKKYKITSIDPPIKKRLVQYIKAEVESRLGYFSACIVSSNRSLSLVASHVTKS